MTTHKLVPCEPTKEMLDNVDVEIGCGGYNNCGLSVKDSHAKSVYASMLESAPEFSGAAVEVWQPMSTAPKDGTILRLRVAFDTNPLEDDDLDELVTIGQNSFENTGADAWQLVGWDWQHDRFVEAIGRPQAWMPLVCAPQPDRTAQLEADKERLLEALANTNAFLDASSCFQLQQLNSNATLIADMEAKG